MTDGSGITVTNPIAKYKESRMTAGSGIMVTKPMAKDVDNVANLMVRDWESRIPSHNGKGKTYSFHERD